MGGRTRYMYQYVMHESSLVIILRIRTLEQDLSLESRPPGHVLYSICKIVNPYLQPYRGT